MPSRRTLLRAGGAALTLPFAGCLTAVGRDLPVRESEAVDRPVPRAPIDGLDREYATVGALTVGDRSLVVGEQRPHSLWAYNDADRFRTITLALILADDGQVFLRDVDFPPTSVVAVNLLEPDGYAFSVDVGDASTTVRIEESRFDCNGSATDIVAHADGTFDVGTISQQMRCGWTSGIGSSL